MTVNYKLKIKSEKIVLKKYLKNPKYKPIPLILIFGNLIHKFRLGNSLTIYYSYYSSEKKMKLIYAISTKDSTYKNLALAISEFYSDGKINNAVYYEALIVNKRLLPLLKRGSWFFVKKSWFIGDYYKKQN